MSLLGLDEVVDLVLAQVIQKLVDGNQDNMRIP